MLVGNSRNRKQSLVLLDCIPLPQYKDILSTSDMRSFWDQHPEKEELNQYWYSPRTVEALALEVAEQCPKDGVCAFLSTPSVYFAVKKLRTTTSLRCILLDFDRKFEKEESNFVFFDFNEPTAIPPELHLTCDYVVVDPPFITEEVWRKYSISIQALLRPESGKILLTTIRENEKLIQDILNCSVQKFKPSIPNLVYQYSLFTNYPSSQLSQANPEIVD